MIAVSCSTNSLSVSMRSLRGLDFLGFESGRVGEMGIASSDEDGMTAGWPGWRGRCSDMKARTWVHGFTQLQHHLDRPHLPLSRCHRGSTRPRA